MFAAYQAGVWKAVSSAFRPDIVIGASAGALNGWAIAGGCEPDELAARLTEAAAVRRLSASRLIVQIISERLDTGPALAPHHKYATRVPMANASGVQFFCANDSIRVRSSPRVRARSLSEARWRCAGA